jgi:hypothetical protein
MCSSGTPKELSERPIVFSDEDDKILRIVFWDVLPSVHPRKQL